MAEAVLHDCDTQKNEIAELLKTQLIEGDTWYLVSTRWFIQWKKYVGFDTWDAGCVGDKTVVPGPIDNSPLCKEDALMEHLIHDVDYYLVPEDAWKKLLLWYDIVDPKMVLSRKVIAQGIHVKHCEVEVYLVKLKLCHNRDLHHVITEQFSMADTIKCLEKTLRQAFNINDDSEVRLWNKYMSNTYEHLNRSDLTIQDAGLYQGTVIVIEEKNADGTWPRKTNGLLLDNSATLQSTATTTPCDYSVPTNAKAAIAKEFEALDNCISRGQQDIHIKRDALMNELLERYKDETITQNRLHVEFLGEPGADTGGLTKELFTCFWSEASRNLFRGKHCLVPDLPLHRMRKESWKFVSLGRILSHMVALTGTIPHTLARSTFIKLATNSKVDDITLLEDFLLFVTPDQRALLSEAMSSFSSLTEAESECLSSFYSAHGYLDIPRKTEICEQILAIAEQELVQKPAHLTSLMHQGIPLRHRDAFWKHLSVDHITKLMQSQKPTPERVAAVITSDKDDLTVKEKRMLDFVKEFIANLNSESLMAFLIYVTASACQPEKITVIFNELSGCRQHPTSCTCSNTLKLPITYQSYEEFKNQFKVVLNSPESLKFSVL